VLYCVDPCLSAKSCRVVGDWVKGGGWIYGAAAAGSRNEFNESHPGLAEVFGIKPDISTTRQRGRFDLRGGLNALPWMDEVSQPGAAAFGALGLKIAVAPGAARVAGTFKDGSPAVLEHQHGKGRALYAATCPALSYAKDANFVPAALREKWPAAQREFINAHVRKNGAARLVELSHPVVEAGIFESDAGAALVLANFQYDPIARLEVRLPLRRAPGKIVSMEKGPLEFRQEAADARRVAAGFPTMAVFSLPLGWNDIVVAE
jgi:hypothetical protein